LPVNEIRQAFDFTGFFMEVQKEAMQY
jgi:hypothetical protein